MVSANANYGNYNVQKWASDALDHLQERRGIARLCNRAWEGGADVNDPGDRIKIRQPGAVAVKDENDYAFETLKPRSVDLIIDQYRHASFEVTDQDLVYGGKRLMDESIFPAVDAMGEEIERDLFGLKSEIGPHYTLSGAFDETDLPKARAVMTKNKCPVTDRANMFAVFGADSTAELTSLSAFAQHQGAGNAGVETQVEGYLGRKYGFNCVESTLPAVHVPGAGIGGGGPFLLQGAGAIGDTSITVDAGTLTGGLGVGDIVNVTHTDGSVRGYAVAAAASAGGNAITVTLSRGLTKAAADNSAVTFTADAKEENLAFHRSAFGFSMGRLAGGLETMGGQNVRVAQDAQSGLSLRIAFGWDIKTRKHLVLVDAMYGVKVFDDSLALRVRR